MADLLQSALYDSPLGRLMLVADSEQLHLLFFIDSPQLDHQVALLQKTGAVITPGSNRIIAAIESELDCYFIERTMPGLVPLAVRGSSFQRAVWQAIRMVPSGTTISYGALAAQIGTPTAYRAVAQAARANPFQLVVPCHRVWYTNGMSGGYSGGIARKYALMSNEQFCCTSC